MKLSDNKCPLCEKKGKLLHVDVDDYFFEAKGKKDYFKCINDNCNLIWISEIPSDKELADAYENYYTHKVINSDNFINKLRVYFAREILKKNTNIHFNKFSYLIKNIPFIGRIYDDAYYSYAAIVPGGNYKLLDVGCGNGEHLPVFKQLGWLETVGIDLDEEAITNGVNNGLDLHVGQTEKLPFDDNSFSALTLHHVIEHVKNPYSAIQECHRVLEPGGKISILTPNAISYMHNEYKKYWRGLESPRHLFIFTTQSLINLLESIGFHVDTYETLPRASGWIKFQSKLAKSGKRKIGNNKMNFLERFIAEYDSQVMRLKNQKNKNIGEEVFIVASKSL